MLIFRASAELRQTFDTLLDNMKYPVQWTGIFVVDNNKVILKGTSRSLVFFFDKKTVDTDILDIRYREMDVKGAAGNLMLTNSINMILYIFGKWGSIRLKVDREYAQLNALFNIILKSVGVIVEFNEEHLAFTRDGKLLAYEDVLDLCINPPEAGASEDEKDHGLWHDLEWKKRELDFNRVDMTVAQRLGGRVGNNFYSVGYLCPKCQSSMYMTVFPPKRPFTIDTTDGKVLLARACACDECNVYYTPTPKRLICEGEVYVMDFGTDKAAYLDYMALLGKNGTREPNTGFNHFADGRDGDDGENELALDEACLELMDMSDEDLERFNAMVDEGFYEDDELQKYEDRIFEVNRVREERRKELEKAFEEARLEKERQWQEAMESSEDSEDGAEPSEIAVDNTVEKSEPMPEDIRQRAASETANTALNSDAAITAAPVGDKAALGMISRIKEAPAVNTPQRDDTAKATAPQRDDTVPGTASQRDNTVPGTAPKKDTAATVNISQRVAVESGNVPQKYTAANVNDPQKDQISASNAPERAGIKAAYVPQKENEVTAESSRKDAAVNVGIPGGAGFGIESDDKEKGGITGEGSAELSAKTLYSGADKEQYDNSAFSFRKVRTYAVDGADGVDGDDPKDETSGYVRKKGTYKAPKTNPNISKLSGSWGDWNSDESRDNTEKPDVFGSKPKIRYGALSARDAEENENYSSVRRFSDPLASPDAKGKKKKDGDDTEKPAEKIKNFFSSLFGKGKKKKDKKSLFGRRNKQELLIEEDDEDELPGMVNSVTDRYSDEEMEEERKRETKRKVDSIYESYPQNTREDMMDLVKTLRSEDPENEFSNEYIGGILDKVREIDRETISEIEESFPSMSIVEQIDTYKDIMGSDLLPELKEDVLGALGRKIAAIKGQESELLCKKLMKDFTDIGIIEPDRHHYYMAPKVLTGEYDPDEIRIMEKAIDTYGTEAEPFEYPVLIVDTSRGHTGKSGMMITPDHIFMTSLMSKDVIEIADIESIEYTGRFLSKSITCRYQDGRKTKLPYAVDAGDMEDYAMILDEFVSYLQSRPDSRNLDYLSKTHHDKVICFRCGHSYSGVGECPKCGYKNEVPR